MSDRIQWKETFDGRQPFMEDDLLMEYALFGTQPLLKDDL